MPRTNNTEPVGTPSEGGRWTWDGAQWVRLPELDEAQQPVIPANEE